jgi:hypothetical protein
LAGTIFNVAKSAPPPAITSLTSEPARQFLSSGDAGQTVSDNGTFANLFVEAITGQRRADLNNDGYVSADEMGSLFTGRLANFDHIYSYSISIRWTWHLVLTPKLLTPKLVFSRAHKNNSAGRIERLTHIGDFTRDDISAGIDLHADHRHTNSKGVMLTLL